MKKIFLTILFIVFTAKTIFASNIADEIRSKNCGDVVSFGSYSQYNDGILRFGDKYRSEYVKPIDWYIISKENGKALLFAKRSVARKQFIDMDGKESHAYQDNPFPVTWENCTLRKWLNDEFYNSVFSDEEKSCIIKSHNVNNCNPYSHAEPPNLEEGKLLIVDRGDIIESAIWENWAYDFYKERFGYSDGCDDTDDNVFLLSLDEVFKYFNITHSYKNDEYLDRCAYFEDSDDFDKYFSHRDDQSNTWLRTQGEFQDFVLHIDAEHGGLICMWSPHVYNTRMVRPCIWVSLNGNANTIESDANEYTTEIIETTIHPETEAQYIEDKNETEDKILEEDDPTAFKYVIKNENDDNDLKKNVYFYAKQDNKNNKIYTSVDKKTIRDGLFGTGLFSRTDKIYYNIEIKLNSETTKRLSKYADFSSYNKTFLNAIEWVLLAGGDMNNLENVCNYGVTPATDSDWLAETEGRTYYQNGKIQINCKYKSEQEDVYNKINNANILILATNNVIKSIDNKCIDETKLGHIERFESLKPTDGINWVIGYVDCEDKIIKYTKGHSDYSIYVRDGNYNNIIYDKMIYSPLNECPSFTIKIDGTDPISYAKYGNSVNYLTDKSNTALKKFDVCGGKILWKTELNLNNGFKDFDIFYNKYKKGDE